MFTEIVERIPVGGKATVEGLKLVTARTIIQRMRKRYPDRSYIAQAFAGGCAVWCSRRGVPPLARQVKLIPLGQSRFVPGLTLRGASVILSRLRRKYPDRDYFVERGVERERAGCFITVKPAEGLDLI